MSDAAVKPSQPVMPLRRNRNFLLLQSGQLLSTIGSQASGAAFPLLALALTHSPAKADSLRSQACRRSPC